MRLESSRLTSTFGAVAALLLTVGATWSSGCATGGNYKAVYHDLREARRELRAVVTDRDERISALQTQLADTEQRENELASSEATLQKSLGETTASLEKLQTEDSANQKELSELVGERERQQRELAQVEQDRAELKDQTGRMRTQLSELSTREAEVAAQVEQYRSLLKQFSGMVDSGKLKVQVRNGRMVLELSSDVLFTSASAELSPAGQATITELAAVLKTVKGKSFQAEGHTDNVPIHTDAFASNWYLATARAMVVVETMLAAGVKPNLLSAASFAEYRPIESNKSASGRAANRRIEIVFVPTISKSMLTAG